MFFFSIKFIGKLEVTISLYLLNPMLQWVRSIQHCYKSCVKFSSFQSTMTIKKYVFFCFFLFDEVHTYPTSCAFVCVFCVFSF